MYHQSRKKEQSYSYFAAEYIQNTYISSVNNIYDISTHKHTHTNTSLNQHISFSYDNNVLLLSSIVITSATSLLFLQIINHNINMLQYHISWKVSKLREQKKSFQTLWNLKHCFDYISFIN